MGFTLIELMVSMAIGLFLLSSFVGFLLALSKDTYQEVLKLELSQDYLEVASYLRSSLGRAIFQPHCLHPEWLQYKAAEENHPLAPYVVDQPRFVLHQGNASDLGDTQWMISSVEQYPDLILNDYKLKTLAGSDLLEITALTPLVVSDGKIQNVDDVVGAFGYILATDCQFYVLGRYEKTGLKQYRITERSQSDVQRYLNNQSHIQYYKVHRSLMYVSYEKDQHYLIHNFLDGSNHMRFPNVKGLKATQSGEDAQMITLALLMPYLVPHNLKVQDLCIRLLNL